MQYSTSDWTYGVELEFGNCDTQTELPDGASWNDMDNTCVSTTGIANDPKMKLYRYGGEINTRPTNTIDDQILHIEKIHNALDQHLINYRSNLHIHIRVPNLHNDLEACKRLLQYIIEHQQSAFDIVETIPVPNKLNTPAEQYKWELKRMKRRETSHQHKLSKTRTDAMMAAETTEEFYLEHAHKNAKGKPAWFQCPRAGINLRQMWEETNTIEFRHFAGTNSLIELDSAMRWCREFLNAALNTGESPMEIRDNCQQGFTFPDFQPYEFETEQVYQYTNCDKNNRGVVVERLAELRKLIDIDDLNTTSKEVYDVIKSL